MGQLTERFFSRPHERFPLHPRRFEHSLKPQFRGILNRSLKQPYGQPFRPELFRSKRKKKFVESFRWIATARPHGLPSAQGCIRFVVTRNVDFSEPLKYLFEAPLGVGEFSAVP